MSNIYRVNPSEYLHLRQMEENYHHNEAVIKSAQVVWGEVAKWLSGEITDEEIVRVFNEWYDAFGPEGKRAGLRYPVLLDIGKSQEIQPPPNSYVKNSTKI